MILFLCLKRRIVFIIEEILKATVYERHVIKELILCQFLNYQFAILKRVVTSQRGRMKQDIRLSVVNTFCAFERTSSKYF